jgi:polysaccharide export outer membrane protein
MLVAAATCTHAQTSLAGQNANSKASPASALGAPVVAPAYLIGPDDVLSIVFWRDKDMSADVAVRPDGKISLPLLSDVQAAGLTPLQLRDLLTEEAKRFVEDPNVSVVVKLINSRKVFVTGEVLKPGPYLLTGPTTVLQMIAIAGGLKEYADSKHITIMRTEAGRTLGFEFNYKDVAQRKKLSQNIELKPGDTLVVP